MLGGKLVGLRRPGRPRVRLSDLRSPYLCLFGVGLAGAVIENTRGERNSCRGLRDLVSARRFDRKGVHLPLRLKLAIDVIERPLALHQQ
jgi:hypothetical protein